MTRTGKYLHEVVNINDVESFKNFVFNDPKDVSNKSYSKSIALLEWLQTINELSPSGMITVTWPHTHVRKPKIEFFFNVRCAWSNFCI